MGAKERKAIQDAIRQLGKADAFEIYSGTVVAIDENQKTIDVQLNENVIVPNVRLRMSLEGDEGFYPIPRKDSYVSIAELEGGVEYCLLQCSEIDKVLLKISNTTMAIDKDGVVYNGGQHKGLVKVVQLTQKINALETKVNQLISTLQSVQVALAPAGVFPFAPIFASVQPLSTTQQSDIENTKIKH
jgi:hypothetical protein